MVERILVAIEQADATTPALIWAAELAQRFDARLLVVQVIAPENVVGAGASAAAEAEPHLASLVTGLAGTRGFSRVLYEADPAGALVRLADEERVDLVVVGDSGMRRRGEFLLGNLSNRLSHNARCTVAIVSSPDGTAPAALPGEDGAEPPEGALLRRAARIGRVMAGLGWAEIRSRGSAQARAKRLRDGLEKLGPTFAKLGQILSTRPDLVPPEFVAELATLQDRVTPLTEAEVVAVMEAELHVPWEDVFQAIEPEPLAAGSIAQVHRAVLAGGERVVIKVQRPTAEGVIDRDLRLLEMFTRRAAAEPGFNEVVDLPAMIDQVATSLRRELDFRNEASNMERMRQVLAPFPRLAVPGLHATLSTKRLLVMEEVRGIPVLEAPAGPERREAARQLLESFYQQVLADGFFHADPHPGNLMWSEGRIYFLDLGMAGELEESLRETLLLLLLAFWQNDPEFLTDLMVGLSETRPRSLDLPSLRSDLAELLAEFRSLSLAELRLGPLLQRMTMISLRHGLRLPASLALVGKAFGQMQLATAELDPTLDPFAVAGTFVRRRLVSALRGWVNPPGLLYRGEKLRARATALVESVEGLTGARPGRNLQVDFYGTAGVEAVVSRVARRVAVGVVAAGFLIAGGLVAASTHPQVALEAVLGGAGALLAAAAVFRS